MSRLSLILIATTLVVLPAVGCSGDAPADPPPTEPDLRPWASGPHAEVGLESASGEDVHLSWVRDMDVDSEGRVYIADGMAKEVIVLDPDLRYGRTIGREGEGPGEFRVVSRVQMLPGDSLFAWDQLMMRLTVFEPESDEVAYIHRPESTLELSVGNVMKLPGAAGLIGTSWRTFRASGPTEEDQRPFSILYHLDEDADGTVVAADSLFTFPPWENLVERRRDPRDSRGGAVRVSTHPFGHKPFVQILDGDRIVYASSLALDVKVVSIEGRTESAFSYETTRIGVNKTELRSEADNMSRYFARILRDTAPHTWPPLVGLVVDDQRRIWAGIRKTDRSAREWAAFMPDGTHVMSVDLPAGFMLYAVRDGRAIGAVQDENEVPQVRAYRLAPTGE